MGNRDGKILQEVAAFCAELRSSVRGALKYDETAILLHLRQKRMSTPGEIARTLGLSPSKVSRCLAKIEEMSLVEGIPDVNDLRKCTFRLTNRGENAASEHIRVRGQKPALKMFERYAAVQLAESEARKRLGGMQLSRTAASPNRPGSLSKKSISPIAQSATTQAPKGPRETPAQTNASQESLAYSSTTKRSFFGQLRFAKPLCLRARNNSARGERNAAEAVALPRPSSRPKQP